MIVDVERAAELLADHEVVAYPTETVYGLGVDATSRDALAALFALKRSELRAASVLVADLAALERWADALPPEARRLAECFWPGPLTLVVASAAPELAKLASPRGVGFRCSPHPAAQQLARRVPAPIVSTSCNRTGDPPCVSAAQIEALFGGEFPVVAGDPAEDPIPSTVVAVERDGAIEVLRKGALDRTAIERALAEAGTLPRSGGVH